MKYNNIEIDVKDAAYTSEIILNMLDAFEKNRPNIFEPTILREIRQQFRDNMHELNMKILSDNKK